jgi:hypothetical protein
MTGANFIPSTAINQLEMWQEDTFDPTTIDRELGYAESIGFNAMRVFLHSLVWQEDSTGFKKRVNQYLDISSKHNIQTIFVFFDDCWNKVPKPGLNLCQNLVFIIRVGCRIRETHIQKTQPYIPV